MMKNYAKLTSKADESAAAVTGDLARDMLGR